MTTTVPQLAKSAQKSLSRRPVWCFSFAKANGTVVRKTTAMTDYYVGSTLYEAGLAPQARKRETGLTEASTAVRGLIESGAITYEDIAGGLVSTGTPITSLFFWDARMPLSYHQENLVLINTSWDNVGNFGFDCDTMHGYKLRRSVGEVCSRDCSHRLGDSGCGAPLDVQAGTGSLDIEDLQIGHASGNYVTVSAVTSQTEITVVIPRIAIASVAATGTDLDNVDYIEFNTSTNHYMSGSSVPVTSGLLIPFAIRGQSGGTPSLNGSYEKDKGFAQTATKLRVLLEDAVTVNPSTLGYIQFEPPANWFDNGQLFWQTGSSQGLRTHILRSSAFVASGSGSFGGTVDLVLSAAPILDIQVGDTLKLETGCDGFVSTCVDKFGRIEVFGGQPTLQDGRVRTATVRVS